MPLFGPPDVEKLIAKRDINGLIKALNHKETSLDAADALADLGTAAVEPLLDALLGSSSALVVAGAADALGQIGDRRAVEPLINTLKDSDRDVRSAAVIALGQFADARAVAPLIEILKGHDLSLRTNAAEALVSIGKPAVKQLISVLNSHTPFGREEAASALGQIGDKRALESLVEALPNSNLDLRQRIEESLEMLGWRPEHTEQTAIYWINKGEWDKAAEIGLPAVKPLLACDHSSFLRIEAPHWVLVKIGAPAVGPLIAALREPDSRTQDAATAALAGIAAPAVEPLIAALRDSNKNVRQCAAQALGHIADIRAVEPLIAALRDQDRWVQEAVAAALREFGARRANRLAAKAKEARQPAKPGDGSNRPDPALARFDVILWKCGSRPQDVVQAIRCLGGVQSLDEAKQFAADLPGCVLQAADQATAEEAKSCLEHLGAQVEIEAVP